MKIHPEFQGRRQPELQPVLDDGFTRSTPAAPGPLVEDDALLDSYSRTVNAVVDRVAPSVVNIRVESDDHRGGGGSGFIIARDGFILTNAHVVHRGRIFEVTLHDARVFPAQLIGEDPDTDLAVLRIDAPHLEHVRLADSASIRVGQIAIAIGSPFGF